MPKRKPICDSQIRLLLPSKWVEELDAIAASRHITRLALIRGYLRSRLDHDLQNLAKHWGIVKTNEATCDELRRVTAERKRRADYDNYWKF